MKRGAIVAAVVLAFLVGLLSLLGPEQYRRYEKITADKAQMLTALNAYLHELEQKEAPVPTHVTLAELIQAGYLTREDVAGWNVNTKLPTAAHGVYVRRSDGRNVISSTVSNGP
jgi:hypothetical protein